MRVCRKGFLNESLECGWLSHHSTIVESLGPSLWVAQVNVCLERRGGRFWGEAGAGYLPGSNKMNVWVEWSWFLLVDCCTWVVIVGSACVEICYSLPTRNFQRNISENGSDPKCRPYDKHTEKIDHLFSGCLMLAPTEYLNRHDRLRQYIHWCLFKNFGLPHESNWWKHKPPIVV